MSSTNLDSVKAIARARTQYLIVFDTLLVWDTLCTLRLESRAIWTAKWTLMKVLYLLNRYGSMFWCLASGLTILVPFSKVACDRVYWIQLVEIVYVTLICHAILSVRLYAIYDHNRILKYCLISYLVFETALSIAAMSLFQPLDIPRPIAKYIELEGCITTRKPGSPNLVLGLNIVPTLFDTGVLAATAWKHWETTRRVGQQIPILNRLLFDGVAYYVLITATHTTTAFMFSHADPAIRTFNVPASIVIGTLACSRLVLSLRSRPQRGAVLKPLPDSQDSR